MDSEQMLSNSLYGKIIAWATDNNDLAINVKVIQLSDIFSIIYIRRNNLSDVHSNVNIEKQDNTNINMKVDIIQHSDILSVIHISALNKLIGIVDAQHPPIVNKQIMPIKDSYISSQYPTFNYGNRQGAIIGNYNGNKYRSFLEFDLSFLNSAKLINATLVMPLQKSNDTTLRISVFGRKWDEEGITWNNQPSSVGSLLTMSVNTLMNTITIDLTEYLQNNLISNKYIYDFRLDDSDSSNNKYICINTRENSNPTRLELEYFDTRVYSYGKIQIPLNMIIRQNNSSHINAIININRYNDINQIKSKIFINSKDILFSNINITHNYVRFGIHISNILSNNILSNIIVGKQDINEINSWMFISNPRLYANINIMQSNVIISNIIIKNNVLAYCISNVIIKQHGYNIIHGHININCNTIISQGTMISHVIVKKYVNTMLRGIVAIKQTNINIITSNITICKNNIKSNLVIKQLTENNINSSIITRQTNDYNLSSIIQISNNQVRCIIIIKQSKLSDINNNIIILPANNLRSQMEIVYIYNLSSSINIKGTLFNEKRSKIKIKHKNDMFINIFIRGKVNNNLHSKIVIFKFKGYVYIM